MTTRTTQVIVIVVCALLWAALLGVKYLRTPTHYSAQARLANGTIPIVDFSTGRISNAGLSDCQVILSKVLSRTGHEAVLADEDAFRFVRISLMQDDADGCIENLKTVVDAYIAEHTAEQQRQVKVCERYREQLATLADTELDKIRQHVTTDQKRNHTFALATRLSTNLLALEAALEIERMQQTSLLAIDTDPTFHGVPLRKYVLYWFLGLAGITLIVVIAWETFTIRPATKDDTTS